MSGGAWISTYDDGWDDPLSDNGFDIRDHIAGPAGFLGAAANVIMQLGWPEVGYGVVESKVDTGNVMLRPWKRLRTTITCGIGMSSLASFTQVSLRMNPVHAASM